MRMPHAGPGLRGGVVALELPAAHSAVRVGRHVLRSFVRMNGMADREVETLVLVASELLGNAVDHGGGNSAMHERELAEDERMLLRLELTGRTWTLEVSDQGGGDPAEVEQLLHPEGLPDLDDERGRGFYLMGQMVDRIAVRRSEDGKGLRITATRDYGLA